MVTDITETRQGAFGAASEIPCRFGQHTIDEVAKKAGKYIAGVSANGYIRPERGFGTQWDQFINHITKGGGLKGIDVMEKGVIVDGGVSRDFLEDDERLRAHLVV